jgi:hypothetical protein
MNENIKDNSQVFDSEMSLLKSKLEGSDIFFNLAFALYFASIFISRTSLDNLLFFSKDVFVDFAQVSAIAFLFIKTLLSRYSLQQWLASLALVVLGFITWRVSNENWFFWIVLFVVCGKGADIGAIAKIVIAEIIILFPFVLIQFNLGNAQDILYERSDGTIRHTFGFTHPNTIARHLMTLCISFSYLRFGKNPSPDLLLIIICGYINIVYFDSRSTLVVCMLQAVLLLVFYFVKNPIQQHFILRIFLFVAILVCVFSFGFMYFYDSNNDLMAELNNLLSGRLYLANAYYKLSGITLFGDSFADYETIYWGKSGAATFFVDNAYCHTLLRYGIVAFVVYIVLYFCLFWRLVKDARWDALTFALVLMALYAFTETTGIRIECNYFLIAIADYVLFKNVHRREPKQQTLSKSPIYHFEGQNRTLFQDKDDA